MMILNGPSIPLLVLIGAEQCNVATCDDGHSCSTPFRCEGGYTNVGSID